MPSRRGNSWRYEGLSTSGRALWRYYCGVVKPRRVSAIDQVRLGWLMLFRPAEACMRLAEKYGPVVAFGFGRFRYTFCFGAAANREILSNQAEKLTWGEAFKILEPIDGPTALILSDGVDHARRKKVVLPAFHRRRIDTYFDVMCEQADQSFDSLAGRDRVDIYAHLRFTVRTIVIKCLFGDALADRELQLTKNFETAIRYVNRSPAFRFDHAWPGTAFRRATRARERLDSIVYSEIQRRRLNPRIGTDDVLDWLLQAQDGEKLDDREVRDQAVSLIAAGYDTTASAIGWAIAMTLSHHEVTARLQQELAELFGNSRLTLEGLRRARYLEAVILETLRLFPPGVVSARKAHAVLQIESFDIPAGSMVAYSAHVTHRDPAVFVDPERFDPERVLGAAHIDPFALVGFGGGPRRCIGSAFATQELMVLLATFVRRVDATLVGPAPRHGVGIASNRPAGGVEMSLSALRPAFG